MRKLSFLSVCVIALILDARVLSADESKELRERAVAMRKEAAELLANGHDEESNRLTKESMLLLEKARRAAKMEPGKSDKHHPDVAAMHERLGDLNTALEKARAGNAPEAEVNELEEQVQQTKKKLAHVLERIQSGVTQVMIVRNCERSWSMLIVGSNICELRLRISRRPNCMILPLR